MIKDQLTRSELKLYRCRYHYQRFSAIKRCIGWHFTFDSWLEWWGEDIWQRGGGNDPQSLVMCRRGDSGPYHPDNVYKGTRQQNLDEQADLQRGGTSGAIKQICTPAGVFDSRREAARHYGIAPTTMNYYINRYPDRYYYLV